MGRSKRQLFRTWPEQHLVLFDILKTTANPDDFDESERTFYNNQNGNRIGTISNEVDDKYNNPLLRPQDNLADEEEEEDNEGG